MKSVKKYTEKLKYQDKVNPGHKTKYVQPPRPRSVRFETKNSYNRANNKKVIKEALSD